MSLRESRSWYILVRLTPCWIACAVSDLVLQYIQFGAIYNWYYLLTYPSVPVPLSLAALQHSG